MHLWTSADAGHRDRLGKLSPQAVFAGNGSFHRIARRLLRKALQDDALCPYARDLVRSEVEAADAAAAAEAAAEAAAAGAGAAEAAAAAAAAGAGERSGGGGEEGEGALP